MTTRTIEVWLVGLQAVQVMFLLLHDWVPLGRLSNLAAVRGIDSTRKLLITTVVSALPFVLGLVFSCVYLGDARWPHWLEVYLWIVYVTVIVGAAMAWWIPYLVRPDPERAARYRVRFAGTVKFLPERNGISPDLLHVVYHGLILATVVLLERL